MQALGKPAFPDYPPVPKLQPLGRDLGRTGLGLHVVHSIVTNRLGRRFYFDSAPGEGTKIQMILPRTARTERDNN